MANQQLSILMVCMGNICRSPSAQGVLWRKLVAAGLHDVVSVDSAGTHAYQDGSPPDHRSVAAAAKRGYAIEAMRARRVEAKDFERFDLVLAMDAENLAHLVEICPARHQDRLRLLMEFATRHPGVREVPDPYYGAPFGFDVVLDLVEDACEGLVAHLGEHLDERLGRR
jgi:protein-tyrosine phosphatase